MVESGYTNDQGFIRLPVSTTQTGEVLLTVTKKNHYPYQSSFQIYDSGVSVNIAENPVQIIDDNTGSSIGNSNATANSGETLELYINAKNYGSAKSVFNGIKNSSGDAVIYLHTDQQDPPEIIPDLIKKHEEGNTGSFK